METGKFIFKSLHEDETDPQYSFRQLELAKHQAKRNAQKLREKATRLNNYWL